MEKPKEEKDRRKEEELVAVARELFSRKRFIGYMELSEELQTAFEVKERTAKSYIRFMREKEIIVNHPTARTATYWARYKVQEERPC